MSNWLQHLSPADIGMPPVFNRWRKSQPEAIMHIVDCEARVPAQAVPTGGGKSLNYMSAAFLLKKRPVVLTATKGLQDQLLRDFSPTGLVDIRGRSNYACSLGGGLDCEDGYDAGCRDEECPYKTAYQAACTAPAVVTNYSYWPLINMYGQGLGHRDLLVLDEAHGAADELTGIVGMDLFERDIEDQIRCRFPEVPEGGDGADPAGFDAWRAWGRYAYSESKSQLDRLTEMMKAMSARVPDPLRKRAKQLKAIAHKLSVLAGARGAWVWERTNKGYRLDPLWPSQYTESMLFLGLPSVVMVSATLMPKTLSLLGVPEADSDYREYPYVFPPSNGPVYYIPTVRVDSKWDDSDVSIWVSTIDAIIKGRLDRKGIVHTVSYARRDLLVSRSEYSRYMIVHTSSDTVDQVSLFRSMEPPAILVSPSVSTGYDFPYTDCEYIIIGKLPFPDARSLIMRAREQADPEYAPYLMCQDLVQSAGRGNRAPDDQCEVFIVDDHMKWIFFGRHGKYRHLLPKWFSKLVRWSDTIPEPPPPLSVTRGF